MDWFNWLSVIIIIISLVVSLGFAAKASMERYFPWSVKGAVINTPKHMMLIAEAQGVAITQKEAQLLLDYIYEAEYQMIDCGDGKNMKRHNIYHGKNHSEDEPYRVKDVMWFAQKENQELLSMYRGKSDITKLEQDDLCISTMIQRNICV